MVYCLVTSFDVGILYTTGYCHKWNTINVSKFLLRPITVLRSQYDTEGMLHYMPGTRMPHLA